MTTQATAQANEAEFVPRGRLRVSAKTRDEVAEKTQKTTASRGLSVSSLVLVAVLLAAGAILKLTLGSVLSFAGTKPNFIIAMYCLAILLTRPKPGQAVAIGLIAGLICQVPMMNATPLLNIPSEMLGALAMGLLSMVPMKAGRLDLNPLVATFLSTVVSGYTFVLLLAAVNGIDIPVALVTYAVMVFGTAAFNCILVQVLVVPLRKVLKLDGAEGAPAKAQARRNDGLSVSSLVLVAVLLAAGAILKLTLGSVLSFAGTKPNFIIAMYCLAILLTRPKPGQAVAIGLIAGLICQVPMMNATPLLNIPSEMLGALAMGLLSMVPMKAGRLDLNPLVATFLSTVVSGYTFVLLLAAVNGIDIPVALVTYAVMVFGTAAFNCILVQVLVVPLRKVLKK